MRGITEQQEVVVGHVSVSNDLPLAAIAGLNVIENADATLRVAAKLAEVTSQLGIPFIFKASFDKANRSSTSSYRGPGLESGLKILDKVKDEIGVPVTSDVHEPGQCQIAAKTLDLLQIPAFLSRQTDLLSAAASTGRPLHIKKMQMAAPSDAKNIIVKCRSLGVENVMIGERGTSFGYNTLVVDMLGFGEMRQMGKPVVFDVSHALQLPGVNGDSAGGRGGRTMDLAVAAVTQGIAALFIEVHPDPSMARCDAECATPLARVGNILRAVQLIDNLVKDKTFRRFRVTDILAR
jgi:2-dehydro-3-deoxyphosphooctonate aldolase (KDO 8-P synthase)